MLKTEPNINYWGQYRVGCLNSSCCWESSIKKHEIFATLLKESFMKMGNWFIILMSLTESEEAQTNTGILETEFH